MPEIVTTNISFFEAEVEFVDPNLRLWLDRIAIVEAVYKALGPWNISIDDVEVIQTGKPSEQGVKFKLPEKKVTFFFSAAGCRFTRDNTNWETAEETIQVLDTALQAFHQQSNTQPKVFKTAVALHIQPTTKRFIEIIAPLVPPQITALEPSAVTTMAIIAKWADRRITIDGSAQIANGVFVRYERDFPASTDYATMAHRLSKDEQEIFAMLDIQEEQS